MDISLLSSSKKFNEYLDEVKHKIDPYTNYGEKTNIDHPLLLKGWLEKKDLNLLTKQAYSLSFGCVRHLLYSTLHLGNYLNSHEMSTVNGLIYDYKNEFRKIIYSVLSNKTECKTVLFNNKIEHLNNLLTLIVEKLNFEKVSVSQKGGVSSFFPSPKDAINYNHILNPYELRLLKKIVNFSNKNVPSLFYHVLFQNVLMGKLSIDSEHKLKQADLQAKYKMHVTERAFAYFLNLKNTNNQKHDDSKSCLNQNFAQNCLKSIFDIKADEFLVKIANEYTFNYDTKPQQQQFIVTSQFAAPHEESNQKPYLITNERIDEFNKSKKQSALKIKELEEKLKIANTTIQFLKKESSKIKGFEEQDFTNIENKLHEYLHKEYEEKEKHVKINTDLKKQLHSLLIYIKRIDQIRKENERNLRNEIQTLKTEVKLGKNVKPDNNLNKILQDEKEKFINAQKEVIKLLQLEWAEKSELNKTIQEVSNILQQEKQKVKNMETMLTSILEKQREQKQKIIKEKEKLIEEKTRQEEIIKKQEEILAEKDKELLEQKNKKLKKKWWQFWK